MTSLWRHKSMNIKFRQNSNIIFKILEKFPRRWFGQFLTFLWLKGPNLKKDLKIEDLSKSWRHYNVINLWKWNLGKILIPFSESSENFQEDVMGNFYHYYDLKENIFKKRPENLRFKQIVTSIWRHKSIKMKFGQNFNTIFRTFGKFPRS